MGEERILCRVLTGPTASGKSRFALQLAEEMGWEILCMDSMQIYRRMNIGTAKPTAEEQCRVPHHLLDICEPTDRYSVSEYVQEAEKTVKEMISQGRKGILFVGGTGLYLSGLIHPMNLGQIPADDALREKLNCMAREENGRKKLHEELEKIDPETAARLPLNDIRRTIRAIEVTRLTGIPFSRQPERKNKSPFEWRIVSTAMERARLYERINRRVTGMIRQGLAEEVRDLIREGIPESAQSMNAIGYKEMIPYVRGQCKLEEATEAIQTGTRHYAKRQMTFLRREENIQYVFTDQPDAYQKIRAYLANDGQ